MHVNGRCRSTSSGSRRSDDLAQVGGCLKISCSRNDGTSIRCGQRTHTEASEMVTDYAPLISAAASLLWPILAVLALYALRAPLVELILSAKSRKFTLKIGGQELTMD